MPRDADHHKKEEHRPDDQPPSPPGQFTRHLAVYRWQMIAIPLLALIPVLALLGVFGETFDDAEAASADLAMDIRYPTRFRYKQINPIYVDVTNLTDQTLTVTVSFERSYIDAFSTVTFTPSLEAISEDAYQVEFTDLPPGETQAVTVRIQAEHYWLHDGTIRATADGAEPVEIEINTLTFP